MKRSGRLSAPHRLRRDWTGDAILAMSAGGVLLGAVFLPWANDDRPGRVNFSPWQGGGLNGVLETGWGVPALVLSLIVLVAATAMLVLPARRFSVLLGLLVAVCGVAAFGVAQDAAASIGYYDPGLGMYLTALAAVLLVPIGLVAALVAWLLLRAERASEGPPAPTAPPAPESAPPS